MGSVLFEDVFSLVDGTGAGVVLEELCVAIVVEDVGVGETGFPCADTIVVVEACGSEVILEEAALSSSAILK